MLEADFTEAYIQVDNLCEQGRDDKDKQEVEKPLIELVAFGDLGNHSSTQALSGNDAQPSNEGTNTQVDEHAPLSVPWACPQGDENAADDNDPCVRQEARCNDIVLHLLDVGDRALFGGVEDNDHTTDDAHETADLPDQTQAFLQEDGRENGGDNHGQSTEWCDQDGVSKSVRNKIANFADNHQTHSEPPPSVFQIAIAFTGLFMILLVCLE